MEALAKSSVVCASVGREASRADLRQSQGRLAVSFVTSRNNAVAAKIPQGDRSAVRRPVVCMAKESAARGYASALLDVAKSTKSLEAIHSDLDALSALTSNADLLVFLSNPVILDDKKKSVVKALAVESKLNSYTLNFLYLLVDRKRIGMIREIIAQFEEMYCDVMDTQVAVVTSAVKLEKTQQVLVAKKLQALTGARNIKLRTFIDPSLIAGFVVKYGKDGSQYIDMSVKGQLDRLAQEMDLSENALLAA